MENLNSNA